MLNRKNGYSSTPWIAALLLLAAAVAVLAVLYMDTTGEKGSGLGSEFQYDIEHMRVTDPSLVLYKEVGKAVPTGFDEARALAVGPEDVIWVAGDLSVRAYRFVGDEPHLEIKMNGEPGCIAVADDGRVYVGVNGRVEQYGKDGVLQKRWESAGPDAHLTSISVSNNTLFVADWGDRKVLKYSISGELQDSFGGFVIPSPFFDAAVSPDSLLHVANTGEHRIEAYNLKGDLMSWWGGFSNVDVAGFCGCCNPVNFAMLPAGEGFVTSEKGLTRVKVYDRDGEFVGVVAGPELFERHDSLCAAPGYDKTRVGLDVAVDSSGRVFVLDPATSELRIFELESKDE